MFHLKKTPWLPQMPTQIRYCNDIYKTFIYAGYSLIRP